MSGRSIPRFALVGLLVAALASPAAAQEDVFRPDGRVLLPPPPRQAPEAPMPRAVERANVISGSQIKLTIFNPVPAVQMPQPEAPEGFVPPMNAPQPPVVAPACPTPGVYHSVEYVLPLGSQRATPPCCAGTTGGCAYVTRARETTAGALQAPIVRVIGCGTLQHGQPGPVPHVIRELTFLQRVDRPVAGVVSVSPVTSCPPCPLPPIAPNPLIGTWYRDAALAMVTATFTHDEMKLSFDLDGPDGKPLTVVVTAHYTLTKDGLVYGAITGADVESKTGLSKDDADLLAFAQTMADRPFSFRVKQTSAGTMVSGMKFAVGDREEKDMYPFCGLYKLAKDGKVPAPAATKAKPGRVGKCESGYNPNDYPVAGPTNAYPTTPVVGVARDGGPDRGAVRDVVIRRQVMVVEPLPGQFIAIGSGAAVSNSDVERVGVDFNYSAPVPMMGQPLPPRTPPAPLKNVTFAPPPPPPYVVPPAPSLPLNSVLPPPPAVLPQPAKPIGCGVSDDPMKQMAREAFGEMLFQTGVAVPALLPPVATAPVTAPPTKPGITGTWYREIGPMMCVIKIEADHLTITAHASAVEDGKEIKQGLVVTADYRLTRNGTTVVGLVTGLDMTLEGAIPEGDLLEALGGDGLGQMQKAFVDHPFAFNVRVYGDALMISSVKAPGAGEEAKSLAQAFAGRYKSTGDKPLPKPKPVTGKVIELNRYSADPNDRMQSLLTAPNGVLGSTTLPAGGPANPYLVVPGYQPGAIPSVSPAGAAAPVVPSMTEPTAPPVPPMPQPEKPEVRVQIPPLGPLTLDFDVPLNRSPNDHRQLFNFSIGLFGEEPQMPQPVPPAPSVPRMAEPVKPELPTPQMTQPIPPSDSGAGTNEWRRFWFNN